MGSTTDTTGTIDQNGHNTAFFYGTLMAPEVFFSVCYGQKNPHKVIKDLHTFTPAVLHDYCRHRVQFADYPAIIPEEGHCVRGIFATGLSDGNMFKLDQFEGTEYSREKETVKLLTKDGDEEVEGESKETSVYVFLHPEDLEKREWDFEEFRRDKMASWTRGDWAYERDASDKAANGAEDQE